MQNKKKEKEKKRLRQEDCKFKATLGSTTRPHGWREKREKKERKRKKEVFLLLRFD
jgi:hypothetical protein